MNVNQKLFLPYGRQRITEEDISEVVNVLKSPFITQGEIVPKFEKEISNHVCSKYSVAANSATSALHIACLALDLGPGDYLWTSPITFVASSNCALYCGAKVDFVDIDINTGLICIKSLKKKLEIASTLGLLPKIIIPVHLAGTSCDMHAIKELSEIYKFKIIEDASHAIGGSYLNHFVGSCQYSSITVFSFHPVKIITTGEGGVATTNSEILAEKMRILRCHGIVKDKNKFFSSSNAPWAYEQQILGFNYRMTDFQAALGLSQLKRLREIIIERNDQLKKYKEYLFNGNYNFLEIPENIISSVHLGVILLKDSTPDKHIELFKYMRKNNVGVQLHYAPVYLNPYYKKMGFQKGDFPNSEKYASSAISIPLFPGLSDEEQFMVVSLLQNFIEKTS